MKRAGFVVLLLLLINLLIFFNRNKGFEYMAVYPVEKLYPVQCDPACISKWTYADNRHSKKDIEGAKQFLENQINLKDDEQEDLKVIKIGAYLYSRFQNQHGDPGTLMNSLSPIEQLKLLLKDSMQKLWCGNYQGIFGLLGTAAGLKNRYVELASRAGSGISGTHEVNEVYLGKLNKWVMTDITRNNLMFLKNDKPLSVAEYYNYQAGYDSSPLSIIRFPNNKTSNFDTVTREQKITDEYFNKNFFIRYYLNMDLKSVYSLPAKIKRYCLADPWYIIYDPGHPHSNSLFRVKQFFFLAFILSLFWLVYLMMRNNFKL